MNITVKIETEIEVTTIQVELAVRYEEEDIPNDFPLRMGDMWRATIEVDTGKIQGWPQGQEGHIKNMKVCDCGTYRLNYIANGILEGQAVRENEYVPHGIIPGSYCDYVTLDINRDGIITNWPKKPDVSVFFDQE